MKNKCLIKWNVVREGGWENFKVSCSKSRFKGIFSFFAFLGGHRVRTARTSAPAKMPALIYKTCISWCFRLKRTTESESNILSASRCELSLKDISFIWPTSITTTQWVISKFILFKTSMLIIIMVQSNYCFMIYWVRRKASLFCETAVKFRSRTKRNKRSKILIYVASHSV